MCFKISFQFRNLIRQHFCKVNRPFFIQMVGISKILKVRLITFIMGIIVIRNIVFNSDILYFTVEFI